MDVISYGLFFSKKDWKGNSDATKKSNLIQKIDLAPPMDSIFKLDPHWTGNLIFLLEGYGGFGFNQDHEA